MIYFVRFGDVIKVGYARQSLDVALKKAA